MAEEFIGLDFEKPIIELEKKIESLKISSQEGKVELSQEILDLEKKAEKLKGEIYSSLNPWQKVQLARHPKRPYMLDYVKMIFRDFIELHGDRSFCDDRSIVCGLAFLENYPVVVIGHQKGRNIQENLERNFAMAHPEGYRKALRIMKFAEKFNRPIITFIDTPGAYPGIGAEERGQAEAIARNLKEMSDLRVPIIGVVIGEGGSGGALGIGVANTVLMLENSYYSVISPEGCAAILFHDATKAPEAAAAMKITAQDLFKFKIIDEIINEPLGGAHRDPQGAAQNIKESLLKYIEKFSKMAPDKIAKERYSKFRNMGVYIEKTKTVYRKTKSKGKEKVSAKNKNK
ncbi:MAG: acetyl-CoA carboxylase carboxyltransferase subunit alpha [Elusimicrobia bacterium]|nr:acetyl-CoA carboxylase carboxyltransferase subunit alpha [Elusimicrobiota bacterium]